MNAKLKLGILISGGGTTMLNLHEHIEAGKLDAEIACVVSSRAKVAGVERARALGYPVHLVKRSRFDSDATFSQAISEKLESHGVELVVLGGFLRKYLPAPRYRQACINIHPSLIPAFCGQGFYGMKVHQAVWDHSCKISGCTVHLVDDAYDTGPIILQKAVPITDRDTPDDIQKKVFALECEALPQAIEYFIDRRISFSDRRSIIKPS